jgi:dihydroorotate dehydrogenase electron transfer subunit
MIQQDFEFKKMKIISVESWNESYTLITVLKEHKDPMPGQFYQLKPQNSGNHLLFTPVSIYDRNASQLSFLIKIIGPKTRNLSNLRAGDELNSIGPLGKPFKLVENRKVLLISGGIGYAPLRLLQRELLSKNNAVTWLHGGRSESDVFPADIVYTDDGSVGKIGFVTLELDRYLKELQPDMIYVCGPKEMMKNVYLHTVRSNIPTEFSLEEYMACGIGVCFGCAVAIKEQQKVVHKTVCKDGPVFKGDEIEWD